MPAHIPQPVGSLELVLCLIEGEELHVLDAPDQVGPCNVLRLLARGACPTWSCLSTICLVLIVADLAQNALVPLDLCLLRHLREHLVLVEAQLGCELLDQENVGVRLRSLARVDPVKLHLKHLSLKL